MPERMSGAVVVPPPTQRERAAAAAAAHYVRADRLTDCIVREMRLCIYF